MLANPTRIDCAFAFSYEKFALLKLCDSVFAERISPALLYLSDFQSATYNYARVHLYQYTFTVTV